MEPETFDFDKHAGYATKDYERELPKYERLAQKVKSILDEGTKHHNIQTHSITARAKTKDSFFRKAKTLNPEDPNQPKYKEPLREITDKAGVRIITYFLATQNAVDTLIANEFEIIEKTNRTQEMQETEDFGYLSIHYLVKINGARAQLIEYTEFKDLICEIQVRTILQHAWAEIEHDIQYKSEIDIPVHIRRRFTALAALLELADREFQAVQDDDDKYRRELLQQIREEQKNIEINPTSVGLLLDELYGKDHRVSEWHYRWLTRLVSSLGVKDITELRQTLHKGFDEELLHAVFWNRRPSPPRIAEAVLFNHFRELFIQRHPLKKNSAYLGLLQHRLKSIDDYEKKRRTV